MKAFRTVACAVALALLPAPTLAGRTCEPQPVGAKAIGLAMQLAQRVQSELDQSQAQAAILGRVGSDLSKHGLRYTHAGLAYRDPLGGWTIMHKLNHCGSDRAELFEQGLANFFLDDPNEYRALLLVPVSGLQGRLRASVEGGAGLAVNEPSYSLIAHPYSPRQQNSNGWLLELIAVADAGDASPGRRAAQDRLRRTGYRPSVVRIDPLQRLGAALFRANVVFADHPLEDRLAGRYSIVSVESIKSYLEQLGRLSQARELSLQE